MTRVTGAIAGSRGQPPRRPGPAFVALLAAFTVVTAGCVGIGDYRVGDTETETRSVDAGSVDAVRAVVDMAAGELVVRGGATALADATFTYNVAEFRPTLTYEESGREGRLDIKQPGGGVRLLDMRDVRYDWDVRLTEDVPMSLHVALGAGKGTLDLGRLHLTHLDVEAGAGDVALDLRGSRALTTFKLDAGAGDVTVDMRGPWAKDLDARVETGVGRTTVRLPEDVGVHVEANAGLGKVNVEGLERGRDGAWVNRAYGEAPVTLSLHVEAGVGEVRLVARG